MAQFVSFCSSEHGKNLKQRKGEASELYAIDSATCFVDDITFCAFESNINNDINIEILIT